MSYFSFSKSDLKKVLLAGDRSENESLEPFPAINILEEKKLYFIDIATPGFSKDDITVALKEDYLLIEGKRDLDKCGEYIQSGFVQEEFRRIVRIENNIDKSKIEAKYSLGILRLVLPKIGEPSSENIRMIKLQ